MHSDELQETYQKNYSVKSFINTSSTRSAHTRKRNPQRKLSL